MLVRQVVYVIIPAVLWLAVVLGYTVAYGTILTTTSMPTILPAFTSKYLAGAVPAIGFLATAWTTIRGRKEIGRVSIVSVIIIALLVVAWFFGLG